MAWEADDAETFPHCQKPGRNQGMIAIIYNVKYFLLFSKNFVNYKIMPVLRIRDQVLFWPLDPDPGQDF